MRKVYEFGIAVEKDLFIVPNNNYQGYTYARSTLVTHRYFNTVWEIFKGLK